MGVVAKIVHFQCMSKKKKDIVTQTKEKLTITLNLTGSHLSLHSTHMPHLSMYSGQKTTSGVAL